MTAERRRFSRILYRAPALLKQGELRVAATVQDLSLHGILLSAIDDVTLDTSKPVDIEFPIPESDIVIQLAANIVGIHKDIIRTSILHIDIDSIGHLKRLVELNVGDDSLLHRELEHLTDLGDEE